MILHETGRLELLQVSTLYLNNPLSVIHLNLDSQASPSVAYFCHI